jgi:hypothetical protein
MGTFFVLSVYLQGRTRLRRLRDGQAALPDVDLDAGRRAYRAEGGSAVRFGPRAVVQLGLAAMAIAALVLVGTIDVNLNATAFAVSLIFFRIGAGLLMSQLGNAIMSSVPPRTRTRSVDCRDCS